MGAGSVHLVVFHLGVRVLVAHEWQVLALIPGLSSLNHLLVSVGSVVLQLSYN